jgi:hypothetical protein
MTTHIRIFFNHLGQYQQLEREGALLRPAEEMAVEAPGAGNTADVGHETPRCTARWCFYLALGLLAGISLLFFCV